jgi:hypothetical protein
MPRLLLIAFSFAFVAAATGSFSGASSAADAPPKITATSEFSSADNSSWNEYKKLLANYYFLDKQKAGHISCSISDSKLQASIDAIRLKFKNQFAIDENLHDFSVTYDRTKGVSFNTPHIKSSILSDAKFSDPEQAEKLAKKIGTVFDENINYEKKITDVLLTDLTSPGPEKKLSLTKNGNVSIVSIDEGNTHVRSRFSGTTLEVTLTSPTVNETSTLNYQALNGGLALTHDVAEKTLGSTKTNLIFSVGYQDLGSILFPAQILIDTADSDHNQQTKSRHIEIDFKDCKTSDVSP